MTPMSMRNPRPAEPPAVLLKEDQEGLLLGHSCPYSKYNRVCPTRKTHRVRLRILLAAKEHGIHEISVPKIGKTKLQSYFE